MAQIAAKTSHDMIVMPNSVRSLIYGGPGLNWLRAGSRGNGNEPIGTLSDCPPAALALNPAEPGRLSGGAKRSAKGASDPACEIPAASRAPLARLEQLSVYTPICLDAASENDKAPAS